MKHKKLDLSDLQVDSFETISAPGSSRGTVRAHDAATWTGPCFTCEDTCNANRTCDTGCGGEASQIFNCGENTHDWQNTCGDQFTCG